MSQQIRRSGAIESRPTLLTPELIAHIESGVSLILATRDAALRPHSARALGARVEADGTVTVFLPTAVGGRSVANLRDNGRLAVAMSRIADHHTVQLKGAVVRMELADATQRQRVERYRQALAPELALAGLPEHVVFRLAHWPAVAITVRPAALFDQTPGPRAGHLLREEKAETTAVESTTLDLGLPRTTPQPLEHLDYACFQGLVPAILATCDAGGEPNIAYLSQVHSLDVSHVALSCQFFNKTKRNLLENPFSSLQLYHPLTFQAWQVQLRFLREEKEGPLFEAMAARIQVIASHTGMSGIFRLLSADIHEVLSVERLDDFLLPESHDAVPTPAPPPAGARLNELRSLQTISARITAADRLEDLLVAGLEALDELLGLRHTMVLALAAGGTRLEVLGSRGYGDRTATLGGLSVEVGTGVIGTAAASRRVVRVSAIGSGLAYGRAVRGRIVSLGPEHGLDPEVGLPGLEDAQAQLALPMLVGCRLVGVLAAESRDPLGFDEWDEAFLQIVANQLGARLDGLLQGAATAASAVAGAGEAAGVTPTTRRFVLYRERETIFVDGEYLIRNVPALILWRILTLYATTGQREHANRELRLDRSLGLPAYRDNFESRLILLRKRLEERCPEVRLVPVKRGRFALETACRIELEERPA